MWHVRMPEISIRKKEQSLSCTEMNCETVNSHSCLHAKRVMGWDVTLINEKVVAGGGPGPTTRPGEQAKDLHKRRTPSVTFVLLPVFIGCSSQPGPATGAGDKRVKGYSPY